MTYQVTRDDAHAIVIVKYSGATSLLERVAAVKDGVALLTQSGFRRVLVDISTARLIFDSPDHESEFADVISSNQVLKQCKTAYLAAYNQHGNYFIEILASAKHYNLRHFTQLDAAYHWLMQS